MTHRYPSALLPHCTNPSLSQILRYGIHSSRKTLVCLTRCKEDTNDSAQKTSCSNHSLPGDAMPTCGRHTIFSTTSTTASLTKPPHSPAPRLISYILQAIPKCTCISRVLCSDISVARKYYKCRFYHTPTTCTIVRYFGYL